jgi:hypothetical protein
MKGGGGHERGPIRVTERHARKKKCKIEVHAHKGAHMR